MRHRPKILLVDDQPEGLELLMTFLPPAEYQHFCAESGRDCLEKARALDPDLVLLDIRLPDLDGYEVCRRLRSDPALAEIPIILITAHNEPDARRNGLDAGADDFIAKPFDPTELAARVRSITRLNRYRRLLGERKRFHWMINHCEDGIVILNARGEAVEANESGRRLLGLPGEGALPEGTDFLAAARTRYRLEPESAWADWPGEAAEDARSRYLIRPRKGEDPGLWLEAEALRDDSGGEINYVVRLKDVTEQRISASRIRSFESAIALKLHGRLAATVHGINTLTAPGARLEPETFREILGEVARDARILERELLEILKYLESPGHLYSDDGFCFRDLEPLLSQMGEALGIPDPKLEVGGGLAGAATPVSSPAMESILWELLRNASKFHPARLPAVSVALEPAGDGFVRLRVVDDGVHLTPEEIARAWTPYYQRGGPEEVEGLGLGLPTVASYVWHWGGRCRIFNRPEGPGVAVELLLPRR